MSNERERTPREQETREAESRPRPWAPSAILPDPHPRPGLKHRWVRTSAGGQADSLNVSQSMREGYEPVRAAAYPELKLLNDRDAKFPEGIEVGGLLLCAISDAHVAARTEYYQNQARGQMRAVDQQLMAEQDPRLKTMFRNRTSITRFGPDARRDTAGGQQK